MGKGGSVTVGYWYHPAFHICLHNGPMDALIQIRGGPYTAWSGSLAASGTITIDAANLWGGEKSEGGIQGQLDVMFGDADQLPNAAIDSLIAPDGSAHRGKVTVLFRGGRYGAMNPYPKPISFLTTRILKGWDNDDCWYPEKALVALPIDGETLLDSGGAPAVFDLTAAFPPADDNVFNFINPHTLNLGTFNEQIVQIVSGNPDGTGSSLWDTLPIVNGVIYTNPYTFPTSAPAGAVIWQGLVSGHMVLGLADKITINGVTTFGFGTVGATGTMYLRTVTAANAMNPAHIIYDSLTANDAGAEPVANINDASFRAAADQFYADGFGLCSMYDADQETLQQFRERICSTAAMNVTRSSIDGLWYMDLIRGGGDPSLLPILTDDDILDYQEDVTSQDDTVNQVTVQWFDPVMKQQRTTAPVQAVGSIESFDVINAQVQSYLEIPTEPLALRAAARDLASLSLPLKRLSLTTNRTPYGWRMGTYFKLNAPKRGITNGVFLVGDIDRSTLKSGAIQIKAVQDNYSLPSTTYVTPELGNSQTFVPAAPLPVTIQFTFELPYAILAQSLSASQFTDLDDSAGYLGVVGVRPQPGTAGYDFEVAVGAGAYSSDGGGDWCPTATATADAGPFDASVAVSVPVDLQYVRTGAIALWDNEVVRVDAVDTGANTVTLGRGCVDAIPAGHSAGSRLYFAGGFTASDQVEYVSGEVVHAKLLTRTPGQTLDDSLATPTSLTIGGRQALPYPPAMVTINGTRWDQVLSVSGTFTVAWAERNRVSQGDQIIDQTAATITPEINTRYYLALLDASNAVLVSQNNIGPPTAAVVLNYTGPVTLKLHAINDNGSSLQEYSIPLGYSPGAGGGFAAAQIAGADDVQGLFIIVIGAGGSAPSYAESTDGLTWTTRITNDTTTTDFPHSAAAGKKLVGFKKVGANWYANKNSGTTFWKSNASNWYSLPWTSSTGPAPDKIRYLNGAWLLWTGTSIYTSTDFATWTPVSAPIGLPGFFVFSDLLWDSTNSRYLLFGNVQSPGTAYSIHAYHSTDLITWTEFTTLHALFSANSILADEFGNDHAVAMDASGNLVCAGVTGATLTTASGNDFLNAWTPFIALSTDHGNTWALQTGSFPSALSTAYTFGVSNIANQLNAPMDGILWDGYDFFIYGKGYFGRSSDHGVTWSWIAAPLTHHYNCWTNGAGTVLFQGFGPSGFDAIGVSQASAIGGGGGGGGIGGGVSAITATPYTPVFSGTIVDGGHA